MSPKEQAEIKAIAIQLANEVTAASQLEILLADAQVIYEFLIKT